MGPALASAVPAVAREQKKWEPVARDEPLLLVLHRESPAAAAAAAPPQQQQPGGAAGRFPWLATAGFVYLTFSSGMALHRSRGDPGAAAFVAFAYADLVLLLCCLRGYERADPGSALRDWLRLAVWLLTAALTLAFSSKVAAVMPPAAAALVWAMGIATAAGGFAALFCFKTPPEEMAVVDDKTMLTRARPSSSSPLLRSPSPVSAITLDLEQKQVVSGASRWPPPSSIDLSSPNAQAAPIGARVCGVISP